MRRPLALVLVVALSAVACSTDKERDLARYYDPEGLFAASLPEANLVTVVPPQPASSGPSLLSGVVSQPPGPSPSPQMQFGGGLGQGLSQTEPPDRTVYEAFAVTTSDFEDLSDMALAFLTGDPSFDVREERPIRVDETPGLLVVADSIRDGEAVSSVAAALSLGSDGVGYLIAALFPPGEWAAERSDFLRVVSSFSGEVPPGMRTFPLTGAGA
jgi:hypothetical protein